MRFVVEHAHASTDVNLVLEPKPHQKSCKKVLGEDVSGEHRESAREKALRATNATTEIDTSHAVASGVSSLHAVADNDGMIDDNASTSSQLELSMTEGKLKEQSPVNSDATDREFSTAADDSRSTTSAGDDKQHSSSDIVSYSHATTPQACDEPSASKRSRVEFTQHLQPQLDVMICGNCRTLFTQLSNFLQHKKLARCRLRFVCHCQQEQPQKQQSSRVSDPIT